MKEVHFTNISCFLTTLILHTTFMYGLVLQLLLACLQISYAISIIDIWHILNSKTKFLFLIYWILVVIYIAALVIIDPRIQCWSFYYTYLPMSIAGYFVFVTYMLKRYFKNFDKQQSI